MKDTILEKSKELFLRNGFKTVGMDDIAQSLHISKKTIYQYFPSKEMLATCFLQDKSKSVLTEPYLTSPRVGI